MTLKIILDSNFFFIPSKFPIDIFEGLKSLLNQNFEAIILSPSYNELRTIAAKGSLGLRKKAALALKFVEKCTIVDAPREKDETTDDVIYRIASNSNYIVATNDFDLKRRLRAGRISVIFLRGKSHLELEGTTYGWYLNRDGQGTFDSAPKG